MRAGMTLGGLVVTALFVGGCRPPVAAPEAARGVAVRFRPGATPPPEVARLLERVPNASYDEGLQRAVELLLAAARAPSSRISPEASADALTAAAYPGFAKFSREYNGGAFPEDLADALANAALERDQPVDLALARRNFSDGTSLWIACSLWPACSSPTPRRSSSWVRPLAASARVSVSSACSSPSGSRPPPPCSR